MRSARAIVPCLTLFASVATPCLAQSGSFGNAVLLTGDELVVGEPNTNFRPGTVYVYRQSGEAWQEVAQLRAPDSERADGFGAALARTDNTLFVAQRGGGLHVFRREGSNWTPAGTVQADGLTGLDPGCNQYGYCGTQFGITLAASGDWLLVGEPGSVPGASRGRRGRDEPEAPSPAGVVHVFRRGDDGSWSAQGRLEPADATTGDAFGAAIALADGRALIGAPGWRDPDRAGVENVGRVYEFRLQDGEWSEAGPLDATSVTDATFGTAIAQHGDLAVIGAPGSGDAHGAAFLYSRDPATGTWTEQTRLAPYSSVSGHRFGSAVAVDDNGVWIGAPGDRGDETGAVYVYRPASAEPLEEAPRRIRLAETVASDEFGHAMAVQAGTAVVTAAGADHQAGEVHLYEQEGTDGWRHASALTSPPDALAPVLGEERRCTEGQVGPFDCEDVELLAFVPISMLRADGSSRGVRTNDNWGWTDPETGREYALVGRNDGTSFIDITDPTNPVLVGDLPKTPATPRTQLWRDIKTYEDHAFIVADGAGNHGMQVFDLRRLRDVANAPVVFEPDAHYDDVASVHNIAINEETGFAFLVGSRGGGETCGGALHMVDIREPLEPTFAGCFRHDSGTHDTQCVIYRGPDARYTGREICLNSNGRSFAISDVTDKDNPRAVANTSHPNPAYLHQGWLTDDHRYFYMDDESDVIAGNVPTTRTLIWDLEDLEDPVLANEFMGSMPASAHNLYIQDGFAYQANYRYGLHVLDVSDPENPREVGSFDTSPYHEGAGFSGAWSTYPFFESGTILVTSLQEGLFLLKKRDPTVF